MWRYVCSVVLWKIPKSFSTSSYGAATTAVAVAAPTVYPDPHTFMVCVAKKILLQNFRTVSFEVESRFTAHGEIHVNRQQ